MSDDFPLNLPPEQFNQLAEEALTGSTMAQTANLRSRMDVQNNERDQMNSMAEFIRRYFNVNPDAGRHTPRPPRLELSYDRDRERDRDWYRQQLRADFQYARRSPHMHFPVTYSPLDGLGEFKTSPKTDTGPTVEQMEQDYRV